MGENATKQDTPLDKFRRSVGMQFGFVMYSGLEEAKAIDHICTSAERLIAALSEWQPVETVTPPLRNGGNAKPYVLAIDAEDRQAIGWFNRYSTGELGFTSAKPIGMPTHWQALQHPPKRELPRLPYICEACHVQQYADGPCANCGLSKLKKQADV